jgi:sulfur-carrier protein
VTDPAVTDRAVIRVVLPAHLRRLAGISGEVAVCCDSQPTQKLVLDQLEACYPMLRGTIRDQLTGNRRAFMRFFGCGQDLSHEPPGAPLPAAIAAGSEPYLIVGAMAGG